MWGSDGEAKALTDCNANMLRYNTNKTELKLVTSKRTKHLHSLPTSITIGDAQIPFKQSVKQSATFITDTVRQYIAASGIHGLQRQVRRYRMAQSTLPDAQGGLGLSSAVSVSLSAYSTSLSATTQCLTTCR